MMAYCSFAHNACPCAQVLKLYANMSMLLIDSAPVVASAWNSQ